MIAVPRAAGLVLVLGVALSLVACSAGATVGPSPSASAAALTSPSPSPSASPTPSPSPTPIPSAVAYGPVSVVAGTATCSFDLGPTTTDADGVEHARAGRFTCDAVTNDPRVTGTINDIWNTDYWGTPDHNNGALVQWGTSRLETAGGVWVGKFTGVYSSDRGDTVIDWYIGTGAYKGLTYFQVVIGTGPWTIEGQIYPGSPPTP